MNQTIAQVTLAVRDYDEAIAFYTQKLSFTLVEDIPLPEEQKRWVVVAPPGGYRHSPGPGFQAGAGGLCRQPERRPGIFVSQHR